MFILRRLVKNGGNVGKTVCMPATYIDFGVVAIVPAPVILYLHSLCDRDGLNGEVADQYHHLESVSLLIIIIII